MDVFDQVFNMMNGGVGRSVIIVVLCLVGITIFVAFIDGLAGPRSSTKPVSRKRFRLRKENGDDVVN